MANQTSQNALNHVIETDRLEANNQILKDSIDSSNRVLNKKFIDSTIALATLNAAAVTKATEISENNYQLQKRSLETQIKSIHDATKRFEKQNEPYLYLMGLEGLEFKPDTIISTKFIIKNLGQTVTEIISAHYSFETIRPDSIEILRRMPKKYMDIDTSNYGYTHTYTGNIYSDTVYFISNKVLSLNEYNAVMSKQRRLYFAGKIRYKGANENARLKEFFCIFLMRDFVVWEPIFVENYYVD